MIVIFALLFGITFLFSYHFHSEAELNNRFRQMNLHWDEERLYWEELIANSINNSNTEKVNWQEEGF